MPPENKDNSNHTKLLARLLKGYRTFVLGLLVLLVVGMAQTYELVIRLDERGKERDISFRGQLADIKSQLADIEERQFKMQARPSTWDSGEL